MCHIKSSANFNLDIFSRKIPLFASYSFHTICSSEKINICGLIVILQHWQIVLKDPSSHGLVFYNNFQNAKSDDCQQAQMFDWPTGWQKVLFHQSVNLQDRIELLC